MTKEEALNAISHLQYSSPHEAAEQVIAKKYYSELLRAYVENTEPVKILYEGDSNYPLPMMLVHDRDNYTIIDVGGVCCIPLYQVVDILSEIKPDIIVRNGKRICPNCGAKMDGEGNG